ncbi:MAG: helix-turn-helix transcriptional regulator [Phyllobacterium sp.]|nr:helix-turn-helix transcriptional regulator [Phyllobacterium sp.]
MTEPNEPEQSVEVSRQEFSLAYCHAARALLDWSQVRLAAKSNLSESTIRDFESGRCILSAERIAALRKAFETAGVTFTVRRPFSSNSPGGRASC